MVLELCLPRAAAGTATFIGALVAGACVVRATRSFVRACKNNSDSLGAAAAAARHANAKTVNEKRLPTIDLPVGAVVTPAACFLKLRQKVSVALSVVTIDDGAAPNATPAPSAATDNDVAVAATSVSTSGDA